jgi:hypothetical protein
MIQSERKDGEDLVQANASTTEAPEKVTVRSEWRPIETAPKRIGISILLTVHGCVGEGYWDEGFEGSSNEMPYSPGWCIPSLGMFNKLTPTHWMPLPLAPDSSLNFSNEAVSDAVQLNKTSLLSSSDTEVGDK